MMYYFIYLLYAMCLCVDIVPVFAEQPVGEDQEEPLYEEESVFVEEGKWLPPHHNFCPT